MAGVPLLDPEVLLEEACNTIVYEKDEPVKSNALKLFSAGASPTVIQIAAALGVLYDAPVFLRLAERRAVCPELRRPRVLIGSLGSLD